MKAIQIVMDETLLKRIDKTCGERNRSAFFREAAQNWLKKLDQIDKEKRHARGYLKHPVKPGEFSVWESEQAWPD